MPRNGCRWGIAESAQDASLNLHACAPFLISNGGRGVHVEICVFMGVEIELTGLMRLLASGGGLAA